MMVIRVIIRFFLSLRTTMWLMGLILALFFAGAFIMPDKKEFQSIHAQPLFEWLIDQPAGVTWWMWCLIVVLSIVSVNTIFCSIESIIRKRRVTQWLLLISPQIIHLGFLFILLAHLLSAFGGYQDFKVARKGSLLKISGTNSLYVRDIDINTDANGYITGWEVEVEYFEGGKPLYRDSIRPNDPSLRMGFNVNVKDLKSFPYRMVLLQVNREPGALWALIGGIMSIAGIVVLIMLRIKTEGSVKSGDHG
jgi:hypothetical protein